MTEHREPRRLSPTAYSSVQPDARSDEEPVDLLVVWRLLKKIEQRLEQTDRRLAALEAARGASRTTSRREMPASIPPSNLTTEDLQRGGEFLTYVARGVIAKVFVPSKSGVRLLSGEMAWSCCRVDNYRPLKARVASKFFRVPEGWTPPGAEEDDETD